MPPTPSTDSINSCIKTDLPEPGTPAIQRLKFSFGVELVLRPDFAIKALPKGDQYIICPLLPTSSIPGDIKSPFHSPIMGSNTLLSAAIVFMPLPRLDNATPTPTILGDNMPLNLLVQELAVTSTNCIGKLARTTAK
ncbi:hypothetical protein REISMN_08010 [Rickettsia tamurae subsp. buchneri]|uniref:Uncharacterized protein n=1 Tax=Rickettsia tamurae subsp. buchneri TaxID=1462938 RepID=A0A8E0WKM4_9RICK|nr:hypothetical protein REISMN_08010 [Rickettsia tamurae subsp. buchneri]